MRVLSPFLSIVLTALLARQPLAAQVPSPSSHESLQLKVAEADPVKGITVTVTDAAGSAVADAAVVFRLSDGEPVSFADGSHASVAYTDASGQAHVGNIQWGSSPVAMRITAAKGTAHAGIVYEPSALSAPVALAAPVAQPVAMAAPIVRTVAREGEPVSIQSAIAQPGRLAQPESPAASLEPISPGVSIVSSSNSFADSGGHSKTKWFIVLGAAAGAGIAFAMLNKGKSSSSSASTPGISIGAPSVSVGHP